MAFDHRHLIDIREYSEEDIALILDTAKAFSAVNDRKIKKVPTLRGLTIVNMFNEPSTRTRSSFELAEKRLSADTLNFGGSSTSSVKGESLIDTVETLNAYKIDAIVVRDKHAGAPHIISQHTPAVVIDAGDGKHQHPTQALLDLYTLWRKFGHIEGLKVTVAAADMIEARTGHSMAQGLARLGAEVTIASPKDKAVPREVIENIKKNYPNAKLEEAYDFEKDSFNEFIRDKDLVYLPGCSAPAGATAEAFKKVMDDYFVKHETLDEEREKGHMIYVTHTLPRRAGEMDLAIDDTPNQLCFESILHSVSIRMALLTAILGA